MSVHKIRITKTEVYEVNISDCYSVGNTMEKVVDKPWLYESKPVVETRQFEVKEIGED